MQIRRPDWYFHAAGHVLRKKVKIFDKLPYSGLEMVSTDEMSTKIKEMILSDKPFCASRMGFTEQAVIRIFEYNMKDKYEKIMNNLYNWSGFFPNDVSLGKRFTQLMTSYMADVDLYACNMEFLENHFMNKYLPRYCITCRGFEIFEVFKLKDPWTAALKGKKVLVVTPFTESVKQQYAKREKIYAGSDILPEFELKTYRSQMTLGGMNEDGFKDWFEALDHMNKEIEQIDFDIALIGCGAYGFPIASQIKRTGRQAVCMGGVLQILFGIQGRRWDGSRFGGPEHMPQELKRYCNEDWTYPIEERPAVADKVEYGPYWK
ncbi:MAG: hypothetical protein IJM34_00500 [Lachnospiraceae bacterium]|nr:hypothetical protein [Lachnospiraceae bacterium]